MENPATLPSPSVERCYACAKEVANADVYCNNCGYPLKGTEWDQKKFIGKQNEVDINLPEFQKRLTHAANSFYYLAGAFIVYGLFYFFIKMDDPGVLSFVLPNFILAIVFLVLGAYSKIKPLACIVSGLCLYIIVLVLNAVGNPASIASGIILKIIIIGYLVKGIKSALEIEKIKKENNIS
ncbi:hypothetical protein [Mucilaginibacter gotjawali]|uniref:Uncharacterized protein n=2 Tax=Mucilaginibacter gotjawali TaxID=1550579 RepID=A0A839SLV2_9SPHI|nr:hypothetical protein [Mucilaginibacter gotjawali]MBB3058224.1 hypothetical protein [Mucilaginibacter gotjawali]BAU54820.1 hypothetical protein MgSA37_02998 [Mucilaginibacter gotjawali]